MRRIHRAKDKEDLVKSLVSGESPLFGEIWRVLIYAACLGYHLKRREPLGATDPGKALPDNIFSNSTQWPGLLYLFGLSETDSSRLLHSSDKASDELVTIFEEYANGGLSYLQEKGISGNSLFDQIIELMMDVVVEKPDTAVNLEISL